MVTANCQWPLFYQGLQRFDPTAAQPVTVSDFSGVLQHSHKLTLLFLGLAEHNVASVLAQLNLTLRQLSLVHARVTKMMTLGLIFSRGFGWQSQRSQLFLQAICLHAAMATMASNPLQATLALAKALQQFDKQHPLLPLLIATCNARRHPAWQCHPDGPLLALIGQLAEQMLPESGNQAGLAQVLLYYRRNQDESNNQSDSIKTKWFGLLQQLVANNALPGRFGKDSQAKATTSDYWFISGLVADTPQSTTVYVRAFDPSTKTLGNEVSQLPLPRLSLLSPQYFRDPAWLALLEPDNALLPATSQMTLKHCLEQSVFNQLGMLSISKQVQLLQTQPQISRYLERAAGNISRQQIPVSQLRHAITMLGQDALSDWVAQAELSQYCVSQAHPHHNWLEQLQHCLTTALLLISAAAQQPLALCTAGLVARCASVSLWQHAALPQLPLAKHIQQKLVLGLHIHRHIWQSKTYPGQLQALFQHYQHPDWATAVQDWHNSPSSSLGLVLNISWQLTLAVFCATDANTQQLAALLPSGSARLKLPSHSAQYWQQQLIAASQCYYPLPEI
ncbi:MAG: hypothetical protein CML20_21465 [Rheinheimera sp.]|nr:hypothetical protein [Rheinheimera sp.]